MPNPNMHLLDRAIRICFGAILIWIGFIDRTYIASSLLSTIVGLFGIVNVASAVFAFCPMYHLAGICSLRRPENR